MDVHLRDLRYFVAVAEELHFTRAAERLFVSQPALSRQIAKLEADLRVRLLDRDRRTVSLTPSGAALLVEARELLATWDAARRTVSDAAAEAASVVRVGMQTSVGRGIVERLSAELRSIRPTWRIDLAQVAWDDPTAGLADRRTDVALSWLPIPGADDHRWVVVATEPRHLAISTHHELAGRASIGFAEMVDLPLVALPEEAGELRRFWLAEDERSAPAPVATVAATPDAAMEAVIAGLGGVLLSEGNAALYDRPGVISIPVTDLAPSELALVWRADDHRDVIRELVGLVAAWTDG
ncbi:MAG: LysR family transcriptional regulator [Actinomycetota bacterium]